MLNTFHDLNRPVPTTEPPRVANSSPGIRANLTDYDQFEQWCSRREKAKARLRRLTARERQVAMGVFMGQPNKKIAEDLGVTSKTVEKHRAQAMLKANCDSTVHLVRLISAAGMELSNDV